MNACTYIVVLALFQYADPRGNRSCWLSRVKSFFYFAVEELKKNLFCNGYSYLS